MNLNASMELGKLAITAGFPTKAEPEETTDPNAPAHEEMHNNLKGQGFKHVGNDNFGRSAYVHPSGNMVRVNKGGATSHANVHQDVNWK